jgi:putative transposase
MISRDHPLPIQRQVEALDLNRSTVYYIPKPVPESDLVLMRRIDEIHLDHPFAGSRMIRDLLRNEGSPVGRRRIRRLMKKMGIEAIYRRSNTSRRNQAHRIYPYLLRGLKIDRPNQVWAMDTTYVPMKRGFVYLTVVLDWATRKVLTWRVSNSLTPDSCVEALEEAILRFGGPEIMNTDQGSQFTSSALIGVLVENGIAISMDGRGCWRDNVFVERLWRTIKYEEIYLHGYASVSEAKANLARYIGFYNGRRPHSHLDGLPPDAAYFTSLPQKIAA